MAVPLTASHLLAALEDEGCRVVEVPGWRTRNRNGIGAWGPVHGTMTHHTVTSGSAATVRILRDGYAALPGPLCLGGITKDGTVHLIGYGRTNHAGGGDPRVLARVISEDYGDRPPKPTVGNRHGVDGNARFYGFECENLGDGEDPWPDVQLEAIERANAALLRAHGWTAKSAIGHLEWSSDKIDPRGFSMVTMRARIAERLTHPAGWTRGTTSTPPKEDGMSSAEEIYNAVWRRDIVPVPADYAKKDTNPTWWAETMLRDTNAKVRALAGAVTELAAQGAARDAVLAKLAEGGGLTAAEIEHAAQAGATAALDRLAIALAAHEED
jgi:hypothetical protein